MKLTVSKIYLALKASLTALLMIWGYSTSISICCIALFLAAGSFMQILLLLLGCVVLMATMIYSVFTFFQAHKVYQMIYQDQKKHEGFQLEFSQNDQDFIQFCLSNGQESKAQERITSLTLQAHKDYQTMHQDQKKQDNDQVINISNPDQNPVIVDSHEFKPTFHSLTLPIGSINTPFQFQQFIDRNLSQYNQGSATVMICKY